MASTSSTAPLKANSSILSPQDSFWHGAWAISTRRAPRLTHALLLLSQPRGDRDPSGGKAPAQGRLAPTRSSNLVLAPAEKAGKQEARFKRETFERARAPNPFALEDDCAHLIKTTSKTRKRRRP